MTASVTVTDTTLFHVAARYLGDATQWDRVATRNGLTDPIVTGTVILVLPNSEMQANSQAVGYGG